MWLYLVYKTQVTQALCGSLKPLKLMCQAGLTWEKKIWILTTQISEISFLFPARLLLKVGDILLHMI